MLKCTSAWVCGREREKAGPPLGLLAVQRVVAEVNNRLSSEWPVPGILVARLTQWHL